VSEPEGVPELVEKDAADIGNRNAMGDELQGATIRIEDGSAIEERIRLHHVGARARVVGNGQSVRAERLAKNGIRKHDGIDAVAVRHGRLGVEDIDNLHALEALVPHIGDRLDGRVPRGVSVLEYAACVPEAKLKNQRSATRPSGALEHVTVRGGRKACDSKDNSDETALRSV
jgi:hypothetical protein